MPYHIIALAAAAVAIVVLWIREGRQKAELRRRNEELAHQAEQIRHTAVALQHRLDRSRQMIEGQSGLVCRWRPDTTLTFVNQRFCAFYAKPADELLGTRWLALLPEGTREHVASSCRSLFAAPRLHTVELQTMSADGHVCWHRWVQSPLLDEAGELLEWQSVGGDITEEKERDLERDMLAQVLTHSQIAAAIVEIVGKDRQIIYLNPRARNWLDGCDWANAGSLFGVLPGQPAPMAEAMWRAAEAGRAWQDEFRLTTGGRSRWVSASIMPVGEAEESMMRLALVLSDVDQIHQTANELREMNQCLLKTMNELRQSQQEAIRQEHLCLLGRMAGGIAHDFNNALTIIKGYTDLLLQPAALEDAEQARDRLAMVRTAAEDAARIVGRMREFHQHRAPPGRLQPVHLNHLVETAVDLTRPLCEARTQALGSGIVIHTDLADVPAIVGHEGELRVALTNLITNAIEAIEAIEADGAIRLRLRQDENTVVLAISDDGCGMTRKQVRHCLEAFYSTRGEAGTGLGLAVVNDVVERHSGSIDIHSVIGQGTTFRLIFPLTRRMPAHPESMVPSAAPGTSLRILVVDDEQMIRHVVAELLRQDGHTVNVAESGLRTLERLEQDTYDLIITDQVMPGINGQQLTAMIKARKPEIPVIMLTGFGDMMKAKGQMPAGVHALLTKPVDSRTLSEAVAAATASR